MLFLVISTAAHASGPTWAPRLRLSTDNAGTSVQQGRSHWLTGALIGLAVGAGATYLVLHSGGSTSLCNRSENQDALNGGECAGLTAAGGLVGAGIGALVGAQFHSGPDAEARLGGARGTGVARTARPGWQLRLRLAF